MTAFHFYTALAVASRAFGLPPPKAAGAKRIYFWGRSPKPHFYYRMEMIII